MTMPNGVDAITPGLIWPVTDPTNAGYDLSDPEDFTGLSDRLGWREEPNVVEFLKTLVQASPGWNWATDVVWGVLRAGVSLPLSIIEGIVDRLFPFDLPGFPTVDELLDSLEDAAENLWGFLGNLNPFDPGFDIADAAQAFIELILMPTNLLAVLTGGLLDLSWIPDLDASIITSGFFPIEMIASLPDTLTDLTESVQAALNHIWTGIMGDDEGAIDRTADEIAYALRNIPALNVIGVNAANMVDTVTDLLDNFWRGLTRSGGTNKSAADVANAATVTAEQADTAVQIGEWNNAVLGLRNNKSLMEGVDETEEANYTLEKVWGVGAEPVAAYAASTSSVPVAYWRAGEEAKKGFISWFGKGITNVTALYIDIYRADYDLGDWVLIHTSPDLIGMASASWQYLIYNIADIEDRIDVVSGDVLGVAWRVTGTGTHSIAGIPIAGMPEHPTIHPKKPVSARTGSGDITLASTAYTANTIPWFGIGIVSGDVPPPYFAPRQTSYTTAGVHEYQIPVSATHLDVVMVGGGGGGQGGSTFSGQHGEGGDAGQWVAETLVRGVDFPMGATTLSITVGAGGNGGPAAGTGSHGAATVRAAIASGKTALTAAGGPRGNDPNEPGATGRGDDAGDFTYLTQTYVGGIGGATVGGHSGQPGGAPGAGGGGGGGGIWGVAWAGGDGGRGGAWVTARQA